MIIVHLVEADISVLFAYNDVAAQAEAAIETIIKDSPLHDLDVKIRYVPIIMGEKDRARYPARSRLDRKNRAYNCSPQLPIEPFLTGTLAERFTVYLNGMRECGPALKKLGATDAQVAAFDNLLDKALQALTSKP